MKYTKIFAVTQPACVAKSTDMADWGILYIEMWPQGDAG